MENKSYYISPNLNPDKAFILTRSDIENRLDPSFYIPSLANLEKQVRKQKPLKLKDFVLSISSGATPLTSKSEKYYTDYKYGIPFIRVQNLSVSGELDLSDCKYINRETHEGLLNRSKVTGNDLLVKITGVGRMAIASVPPKDFIGNINQHVTVIRTKDRETSETLAAFLNTDICEKLASKRAAGGTRPALDYQALLSLPVLYNATVLEIVKYHNHFKNEKLLKADQLLAGIDDYLLKELGITLPTPPENTLNNRIFTTLLSKVSGSRFDPKLYLKSATSLYEALFNTKFSNSSLKSLILHSVSGDWGYDELDLKDKHGFTKCLVIRSTEFANHGNLKINGDRVKYRWISNQKLDTLGIRPNDLLIEKSGGSENQPVGRIAILDEYIIQNQHIAFSNFIHKIRLNQELAIPAYVFNYLRMIHNIRVTDVMQSQTNGIKNLKLEEYFTIPVSLPPLSKQQEIAQHITSIRQQARQLKEEAMQMVKDVNREIELFLFDKQA